MKLIKTLVPLLVILFLSSCSDDEINLEEKSLKEYLSARSDKYIFYDSNSSKLPEDKIPEPIYFDSFEEAEEFLNSIDKIKKDLNTLTMKRETFTHVDNEGSGTDESYGWFKDSFWLGGGVYMNVSFNVDNCEGSGLNSWISGFVLGVTYQHMGGTLRTSNNNNAIDYYVNGVLNYNIFVDGIGTVFSDDLSFGGAYNCS